MKENKLLSLEQLDKQLQSWSNILKNPLWYQTIVPFMTDWWSKLNGFEDQYKEEIEILKSRFYQFFSDKLESGEIALATTGPNFDLGRKSIDTAVIHYTGNNPGISWQTLSAIGLLRQYAHDYYKYGDIYGIDVKNQPIWSGHFREGKQVFYAYHWLVRMDGTTIRLLDDKYLGWQAGNTEINSKSIGITLDGEFTESEPPQAAIEGITTIIKNHYPHIKPNNVIGHLEANPKTVCPGKLFLPIWKDKIIKNI